MLVNVEQLKKKYTALSTPELLVLSADNELSDAEKKVLQQVLDTRDDLFSSVESVPQQSKTSSSRRFFFIAPRWHRLVHLCAVLLALPLLKIVGHSGWIAISLTVVIAWILSGRITYLTARLFGPKWVILLPAVYVAAYYGIYSFLYPIFY